MQPTTARSAGYRTAAAERVDWTVSDRTDRSRHVARLGECRPSGASAQRGARSKPPAIHGQKYRTNASLPTPHGRFLQGATDQTRPGEPSWLRKEVAPGLISIDAAPLSAAAKYSRRRRSRSEPPQLHRALYRQRMGRLGSGPLVGCGVFAGALMDRARGMPPALPPLTEDDHYPPHWHPRLRPGGLPHIRVERANDEASRALSGFDYILSGEARQQANMHCPTSSE